MPSSMEKSLVLFILDKNITETEENAMILIGG